MSNNLTTIVLANGTYERLILKKALQNLMGLLSTKQIRDVSQNCQVTDFLLVTLISLIALLHCRVEIFSEVYNGTEIVSFNGDDIRICIKKLCSS